MHSALCVKKISRPEHTACIFSYFVRIVYSVFYFLKTFFNAPSDEAALPQGH